MRSCDTMRPITCLMRILLELTISDSEAVGH